MEQATSAMEKVPLTHTPDASTDVNASPPGAEPLPESDDTSTISASETPAILVPFIKRVHKFFHVFCHTLGAFFLRGLSTLMLLTGVIAAVILQLLAFYYTGVLNVYFLIACLLYAPALAAVSIIREEMLINGTSRSGAGPRMTPLVSLAYLVISVFLLASFMQPLIMRGDNAISYKSMWISVGATSFFYYCMLVSEVLFAAALNVRRAKEDDEERLRREREDPPWITQYDAIHSDEPLGLADA